MPARPSPRRKARFIVGLAATHGMIGLLCAGTEGATVIVEVSRLAPVFGAAPMAVDLAKRH